MKTVADSEVRFVKQLIPTRSKPAGRMLAGDLMQVMYDAAHKVAHKHSGTDVTAVKVDEMVFLHPLHKGNALTVHAFLTFVGKSSMEVAVKVSVSDLPRNEEALTAYFVMVALNEQRPTPVLPLQLATEAEKARFAEGQRRYNSRRKPTGIHNG